MQEQELSRPIILYIPLDPASLESKHKIFLPHNISKSFCHPVYYFDAFNALHEFRDSLRQGYPRADFPLIFFGEGANGVSSNILPVIFYFDEIQNQVNDKTAAITRFCSRSIYHECLAKLLSEIDLKDHTVTLVNLVEDELCAIKKPDLIKIISRGGFKVEYLKQVVAEVEYKEDFRSLVGV